MADMYAHQVRVYTRTGALVSSEGSRGDGPGQFLAPVSARRTRNGGILVTDALAVRSTYYGSDALRDPEVALLPTLFPVDQVDLGYGQTLVVGPGATTSSGDRQMLHVWNPDSSKTVASFFPDPSPDHLAEDAEFFGDVDAEIARDTIWAVVALSDSVYAMDMDGARIGTMPLPLLYQTGPYEFLWRIMSINQLTRRRRHRSATYNDDGATVGGQYVPSCDCRSPRRTHGVASRHASAARRSRRLVLLPEPEPSRAEPVDRGTSQELFVTTGAASRADLSGRSGPDVIRRAFRRG